MAAKFLDPATLFPRQCNVCQLPKARDDFETSKGRARRDCLSCSRKRKSDWMARNPGYSKARRKLKQEDAKRYGREWRRQNPGYASGYRRRRQAIADPGAVRRGQVWTSAEMALAARPDLTAQQVAIELGRTIAGVNGIRQRILRERAIREASDGRQ